MCNCNIEPVRLLRGVLGAPLPVLSAVSIASGSSATNLMNGLKFTWMMYDTNKTPHPMLA